jgi:regulator of replication initiation timing
VTELRNRFVERVREATRTLIEDLLEANRRLWLAVEVVGQDRDELRKKLSTLKTDDARWQAEQEHVLELLTATQHEYRKFEAQFIEIERQNSNLATLYAAGYSLHSSVRREDVLAAAQEVVINLIGSEQFAIVDASDELAPLALFGVRPDRLRGITRKTGIVSRASAEGRPLALPNGVPADSSGVRVCIPLSVGDERIGFVLIFGFLPQKSDITPLDYELFSLIGTQAATALYCANLHEARLSSGRAAE